MNSVENFGKLGDLETRGLVRNGFLSIFQCFNLKNTLDTQTRILGNTMSKVENDALLE